MSFRWPLDNFRITQGFGGNASYYAQFGQRGHNGIDMGASLGTPVYAADEGTVAFEGWGKSGASNLAGWMGDPAGICILINHIGSYGGYAHLNDTVVNVGQKVSKGQLIGHVGQTGAATGPHLHFEMLPLQPNFSNGFAGRIDPSPYIETSNNASANDIRQAYRDILERDADDAGVNHYQSYPLDFVRNDLNNSQEKRDLEARKAEQAKHKAEEDARVAAEALQQAQQEAEREAAQLDAQKAEEEKLRVTQELERIQEEERMKKEAAENKAKAQSKLEETMATIQEYSKDAIEKNLTIVGEVAESEVAKELTSGIPKKVKLAFYIVGDVLIVSAGLLPSVALAILSNDPLVKITTASAALGFLGAAILTFFGIYKSGK